MTQPVRATVAPHDSRIAALVPNSDFHDAWCIESPHLKRSALGHFSYALRRTPRWVDACMNLRNRAVALVGLKNLGVLSEVDPHKPIADYQIGERIGIFTLFENHFDEAILGDQDKHLDVFIGIQRRETAENTVLITITTVVKVHNWLGHLYMLPVKPMHRIIAPRVLRAVG